MSRREHYQWNMDIWGVGETDAEGELLCAVVIFLQKMGLGPSDVCIKVEEVTIRSEMILSLKSTVCLLSGQ